MICDKDRYETRQQAMKVANALHKKNKMVRAYPCKECGGYHLTSQNASKKKTKSTRPIPPKIDLFRAKEKRPPDGNKMLQIRKAI